MATYYIATTGNDTTGNGTVGNPWATFAKFLSSSVAGDTVIVGVGTFTWASATIAGRVIVGQGPDKTVFSAAGAQVRWNFSAGTTNPITGIRFTNNLNTTENSSFQWQGGSFSIFTNCIFDNFQVYSSSANGSGGVFNNNGSGVLQFINCLFYSITGNPSGTANVIWRIAGSAQILTTGCTIALYGTGTSQLHYLTSSVNMVYKNTIAANYGSSMGSHVFLTPTATYSCFYGLTSPPTGTGVITTDPLLVDGQNGNLNLRPGSPCIDTGTLS
jgi:hypothetical protein